MLTSYVGHGSDTLEVTALAAPGWWSVKGKRDRKAHSVKVGEYTTLCTCRMARMEGDCKHIAAVLANTDAPR